MQWLIFLCVTFALCIFAVKNESNAIGIRSPYGFKMCTLMCERYSGCRSFVYAPTRLMCRIEPKRIPSKQHQGSTFNLKSHRNRCPRRSRLMKSRGHKTLCVPDVRRIKKKAKKILFIFSRRKKCAYVYDLNNEQCKIYRHRQFANVAGIAVNKVLGKIYLIDTRHKTGITSHVLYSNITNKLGTSLSVTALTVDELKDCLFLSNKLGYIIMLEDKKFTMIGVAIGRAPTSIAVDSRRSIIFVRDSDSIHVMTYSGNVSPLVENCSPGQMILSPDCHVLYYSSRMVLSAYDVKSNSKEHVKKLIGDPSNMVAYTDALYLTFLSHYIFELDIAKKEFVKKYQLRFNLKKTDIAAMV